MSYDPTDIIEQQRLREAQESALRVLREQEANDFRWLMQHKQGRRILRRLFQVCEMGKDCFTGNSTTFYKEGKQAVGQHFENQAKQYALDHYCTMLKEQQGDE